MSALRYLYRNFEEIFSCFFLAVMISALSIQVIVRATVGGAVSWAEELSRYAFVWAVYIGAALAAKRAAHVCINAQYLLFPMKVRIGVRMLADFIWCAFNIFFVVHCTQMVIEAFEFPELSPTLHIYKAWVEMIMPFAFALMTWRTIELYIKNWGHLEKLVVIIGEGQS